MENNNAPFVVGDKIVRIGPDAGALKKGQIYTCAGCFQCKCGTWSVYIKEFPVTPQPIQLTCTCGRFNRDEHILFFHSGLAKYFAPIQHQYTDLSKEIADSFKQTEETPDKIIVPEKVNN